VVGQHLFPLSTTHRNAGLPKVDILFFRCDGVNLVTRFQQSGDLDFTLANRQSGKAQAESHLLKFQAQLTEPHFRRVVLPDDEVDQLVAGPWLLDLNYGFCDVHASANSLLADAA
jgi:hypothetical protein